MSDETQTETVNAEGEFVAEPTETPTEADPNAATNPATHTLDPLTGAWNPVNTDEPTA